MTMVTAVCPVAAAQLLTVVSPAAGQLLTVVGVPGPQGPPGPVGDASGALLVANRLSELATTPETQAEAQHNLGLGLADPLAYYILAKS
jgi:hypothetical protein